MSRAITKVPPVASAMALRRSMSGRGSAHSSPPLSHAKPAPPPPASLTGEAAPRRRSLVRPLADLRPHRIAARLQRSSRDLDRLSVPRNWHREGAHRAAAAEADDLDRGLAALAGERAEQQ